MEDRRPQNPGRVKITPESGEPYFAKMEMADNPLSEGTPLNTETLLTDETADKIGLTVKTPNKAFSKLWDEVRKINVGVIVPKSIRVKTPPRKTSYLPGDSFDPTGMVIEVTYSNNAKLDATGFIWTPDGALSEGTSSVTITYTEYGKTFTVSQSISVVRGVISVPTVSGSLTYNGSRQSPTWNGYDSSKMTINGNTSEIDAGTYTATFTPSSRYKWSDGSTGTKSVNWKINKAVGSVVLSPNSVKLDPSHKSATVSISRLGNGTISVSGGGGIVTTSLSGTTLTIRSKESSGNTTVYVNVAQSQNYTSASASVSVTASFSASVSTSPKSGVSYSDGLNGLDPKQVNEIAKAISDTPSITKDTQVVYADYGSIHRKLSAVAASQNLSISLNGTSYIFDIIGFNHDTLTSPSAYGKTTATGKAGITLQMHDLWPEYKPMNSSDTNSGSWRASMMRTQTMPQMRGHMPSGWQSVLKRVNKVTSVGGGATSGLETTSDDLFLLTEGEIFGSGWGYAGKGYACNDEIPATPQYAWYKAGNSKVKKKSGSAYYWWERSPHSGYTTSFCHVRSSGSAINSYASSSYGVAFGFCV